jgi:ureidoacrylate peracid hydrolase
MIDQYGCVAPDEGVLGEIAALHKCMVVVIDVQNDFCSTGGAFDRLGRNVESIRRMLPTLAGFVNKTRQLGGKILFTRHQHQPARLSPFMQAKERLLFGDQGFPIPGTWGEQFCPMVAPEQGDLAIAKHHYSAFSNPQFEALLAEHGVQTLVLTGVLTNVCVETTTRDTDLRDYYAVVVEDCVASDSPELHRATLTNLRDYFGWVVSSRELLALWSGATRS